MGLSSLAPLKAVGWSRRSLLLLLSLLLSLTHNQERVIVSQDRGRDLSLSYTVKDTAVMMWSLA